MSGLGVGRVAKVPDSSHPITIEPNTNRVTVSFAGRVIADTTDALTLREADYPAVLYIPKRDIDMGAFARDERETYCPYKGDCSYFTITVDGRRAPGAAWSYAAPHPAVIDIRDHVAFYRDRVDAIAEQPAA